MFCVKQKERDLAMKRNLFTVCAAGLAALLLAGCACTEPAAAPAPKPQAKPVVSGTCPVITTAGNLTTAQMAIPTGDVNSSVVLLETITTSEVYVGEAVDYEMKVTNLTDCPLTDVVLTSVIPANFDLKGSAPQAQVSPNGEAQWKLGDLAGKETKSVKVRGIPTQAGPFVSCSKVDYRPVLCTSFVAVAPKLTLDKTMTDAVLLCDPIQIKLVVANPGTGVLRGVKVVDTLPEGLTVDGQKQVTFDAGDLASGQSKTFDFVARASRTGSFTNSAVATAGSLKAEDTAAVVVTKPVLAITKVATKEQFAGRDIVYDIKVTNTGDAPAANLVVEDILPAGVTVVSTSAGGVVSAGKVQWTVPSLAPKAEAAFQIKVKAMSHGTLTNKATAAAVCADAVAASADTNVIGMPAVLLEVIDVHDPLSLGDEEVYTITVTNQGTAPDTNITLVCKIEKEFMTFVAAGGATAGTHADGVVKFQPLPSLAPRAQAVWQVKTKGIKAGDVRFHVEMTTDQLGRPVNETEATQVY